MMVLSIEPPIPELMERLRAHERLMIERLFEVESPSDFRAVLQMRLTLETMRHEIVLRSFAKGTRRRAVAAQSIDETMQGRRFRQHRPL
jgi:hypothetical protein